MNDLLKNGNSFVFLQCHKQKFQKGSCILFGIVYCLGKDLETTFSYYCGLADNSSSGGFRGEQVGATAPFMLKTQLGRPCRGPC